MKFIHYRQTKKYIHTTYDTIWYGRRVYRGLESRVRNYNHKGMHVRRAF